MGSYQIVRSKMKKTKVLLTDISLVQYVPITKLYSIQKLDKMLQEFKHVYIKPDRGRGGKRIISISHDGKWYDVFYETTTERHNTITTVSKIVDKIASGDQFIIQQGISMLRVDKTPFDLRINVQKPYSKWEVTSMIAKLMAPGKIVTNYCQGSTLLDFEQALLSAGMSRDKKNEVEELLTHISEQVASVLNKEYSGLRELGLDVALDRSNKPWILEVNTKPKYPQGLSNKFDLYRKIIKEKYQ